MKKMFLVSDVHGFFNQMMEALDNAGFDKDNPGHIFVSLGDLLDRGKQPIECLKFVNSLPKERKILIMGNHERLLQDCLIRKGFLNHDYSNGTALTVIYLGDFLNSLNMSYGETFQRAKENPEWIKYQEDLVDFYEDDKNIFVHGWIPCKNSDPNKYHSRGIKYTFDKNWRTGDWESARWMNGAEAWNQGVKVDGKTIYCGHWNCSFANSKYHHDGKEFPERNSDYVNFDPFVDNGIVAMDSCCAYSGKLNCVIIEEEE